MYTSKLDLTNAEDHENGINDSLVADVQSFTSTSKHIF